MTSSSQAHFEAGDSSHFSKKDCMYYNTKPALFRILVRSRRSTRERGLQYFPLVLHPRPETELEKKCEQLGTLAIASQKVGIHTRLSDRVSVGL